MHSSRMRTVHCNGHLGVGCLPGGCLPRGCLPGECIPACNGADTPLLQPWTEFLTHACENITFPQLLLQTVKITCCERLSIRPHFHCSFLNRFLLPGRRKKKKSVRHITANYMTCYLTAISLLSFVL